MSAPIVVLGPQRPTPNLVDALDALGVDGPVALITAGWRVDEDEIEPLVSHVAPREVRHLKLYAAAEEVFRTEPELSAAYHARQSRIIAYKDVYRISLRAASMAVGELYERVAQDAVYGPDLSDAIHALRMVDERVLERIDTIRAAHPQAAEPLDHPAIDAVRERMVEQLDGVKAILIAGGHVGVLRNRLRALGIDRELVAARERGVPLIAWSAGAMVLARRIVLFYDDPPEGHGDAEVFGRGLDLLPGVVWLPHARMRLNLDDRRNIALLARRMRPEAAVALEVGARLTWDGVRFDDASAPGSCYRLGADGALHEGMGDDTDEDEEGA